MPKSSSACDNAPELCRANDKPPAAVPAPSYPRLPRHARLPINRCNLPADILGSLGFQAHPSPLRLDGVAELHRDLFTALEELGAAPQRARHFEDYLTVHFRLDHPEDMGLTPSARRARGKATWLRLLRGWLFNPDGLEAAVLKGWVESRFGLLPRHHRQPLRQPGDEAWRHYEEDRAAGLYGTSALEAQLDLVFAFTQHELARHGRAEHLTLYRGTNHPAEYECITDAAAGRDVLLLNNLSSFSASRERADEFGDVVLAVEVPAAKVFFHSGLLPGRFSGEEEYLVIGGLYRVTTAP
jgi:NAD+---dinitrogen-reductase ADP-D-ribosyltransferase